MVCWLLVARSVGWFVGLLMICSFVRWLICQLVCLLVCGLVAQSVDLFVGLLVGWFVSWLVVVKCLFSSLHRFLIILLCRNMMMCLLMPMIR